MPTDLPAHDALADDQDAIDWDRDTLGPMADAATGPEQEPATEPMTADEAVAVLLDLEG